LCARRRCHVGHVSVARSRAARAQRERRLVASSRRVRTAVTRLDHSRHAADRRMSDIGVGRGQPRKLIAMLKLFTQFHVLISLLGIASGFVVIYGMLTGDPLDGW